MRFARILLLLCLLGVCAQRVWVLTQEKPAEVPPPSTIKTLWAWGNAVVPASWTVETFDRYVKVASPDKDAFVYFLTCPANLTFEQIGRTAWKTVHPDFNFPLVEKMTSPSSGYWDKAAWLIYGQSTGVLAFIRIFGDQAYINLIEGKKGFVKKYNQETQSITHSWKPTGFEKKTQAPKQMKEWNLEKSEKFEKFVQEAMQGLKVPGAAIKIIRKDGNPIYEKAFGVKSIDSKEPVTLNTPFKISMVTQVFTSLLVAIGVDQKKFSWQTPVTDIFPEFSVANADFTKKLTLRDTVSASTTKLEWHGEAFFRHVKTQDRLLELRNIKPGTLPGAAIEFSPYLMMTAGCAVAKTLSPQKALEEAYAAALQTWVLDPLGMKHSALTAQDAVKLGAALPHENDIWGNVRKVPLVFETFGESAAPAEALWSSAEDMSRYLLLELNAGTFNDKRIIGQEALLERRKPTIKVGNGPSCALGLAVYETTVSTMIARSNTTFGFTADLLFFPKEGLGFVALANVGSNNFLTIVEKKFLELLFDSQPASEMMLRGFVENEKKWIEYNSRAISIKPQDTAWMESLVGEFSNDKLGNAKFHKSPDGKGYTIAFENWKSRVATMVKNNGNNDTERLLLVDFPGTFPFFVEKAGNVLVFNNGPERYEFVRLKKGG